MIKLSKANQEVIRLPENGISTVTEGRPYRCFLPASDESASDTVLHLKFAAHSKLSFTSHYSVFEQPLNVTSACRPFK